MDLKKRLFLLLSFTVFLAGAQVKIGANPDAIDKASIMELESTDKALVLTRLSTAQMQGITPLRGAMVYNTDTQCIHYYTGGQWENLCDGLGSVSFMDNGDGTYSLNNGEGGFVTFNGAPETVTSFTDNGDGTYTYTNEDGEEHLLDLSAFDNNAADDFDGEWASLNNIPADIADGDQDTQLTKADIEAMGFVDGPHTVETTTTLSQDTATGTITYTNEASTPQTAQVVSGDPQNAVSVGTDGGAYLKINLGGRWTNTDTSTNLNVNGTDAPIFGNPDYVDEGTNLYEVVGNALTVKESGRYDIRANLSLVGINSGNNRQRTNVNARIAINGTPVGAIAASGYIRWASNHNHSSIHVNEILQLNANDVITVVTSREANSGTVYFSGTDEASFMINKLR